MYKEIWEASCGQVFPCLREVGNALDPFAVSVVRDSDIIGCENRYVFSIIGMFSWMESNHKINENLNPSKLNTLTVPSQYSHMVSISVHKYYS